MANNNFDIKVFTDELNKKFTILQKEQVLEKYMKKILLNYNSIIYIGNITSDPNKYDKIYNYMYGADNTLCNIVVFETDGFVDSETNIIPSGIHIAYPYLDYYVCIDYKYKLNSNNSAELLTPTQEFKTINNESILGSGNIDVIGFIQSNPASTLTDDKLQKLSSKKYGLYITGDMFFPTSEAKRFYTVPYINYFGTHIQLVYKDVYINPDNSLSSIFTQRIDLTTTNATDEEVNNLFTNPGQSIPERAITLANLNAFKTQIENEINNQIGNVLQEGF